MLAYICSVFVKMSLRSIYVGETTKHVRDYMINHKSTICCKNPLLPVPYHHVQMGHNVSQFRFQIIEQVPLPQRRG